MSVLLLKVSSDETWPVGHQLEILLTDYKEKVKCQSGKEAYRACDKVGRIEDRKFWMFEFVCALIGAVSASVVFLRQKQLDHKMYQRLQRQIANGA